MAQLETKKINGKKYYYYTEWGWVNGKSKRIVNKYIGKLEDILKVVEGNKSAPKYAEVFQWGLPTALWNECSIANVVETVDKLCPKRDQGLSIGEYIAIAAINRAMAPTSKKSIWEWFAQTTLIREFHKATSKILAPQCFWDHMKRLNNKTVSLIWQSIITNVIRREKIDLSSVSYDGTNFYSFIDTFNSHCEIAKRGKNKQGRGNLRQVSYSLFCCADGHIPLYYDVYEGNRNDARQFKAILENFYKFFKKLSGKEEIPNSTIVFDKGNNSFENFKILDELNIQYVGSVKLSEHKKLAERSNNDPAFKICASEKLKGKKSFRVTKKTYGCSRTLVVTYNQKLFNAQWKTLNNDIDKATEELLLLQQKLSDRAKGIITKDKCPTISSI